MNRPLCSHLWITGRGPYPVERTLLVSGVLEACLRSRAAGGAPLVTPHLRVAYAAPAEPQHARDGRAVLEE
jgi:hypothetical protein